MTGTTLQHGDWVPRVSICIEEKRTSEKVKWEPYHVIFYDLASEVTQHHFTYILSTEAVTVSYSGEKNKLHLSVGGMSVIL